MSQQSAPHLKRALGLVGLTLFGLSYMAVATVFTTYGIVNQVTEGRLPLAYVVALITMIFTAMSYAAMVRRYPVAGSAYTYVQQSYGGTAGFLTGWVLLLDYLFIPMINFMILGLYVGTQFPSIPTQVFSLAAVIIIYVFNVLGIKLANRFNITTVAISVATVVVFGILALKAAIGDPEAPGLIEPFIPGSDGFSPILTGAGILALSFLGFDAVSTLSEEARNPQRDIPRAIILTTLLGGGIFILISWVGALSYHPDDWSVVPQELLDAAGVVLAEHVGGQILATLMVISSIAGCLGSGLAGQVSVSRILYSMGRDGTLPKVLGTLSKRFKTPAVATTVVSVIALSCLFLTLDQAAFMISFGALAAFSMVNLSVIRAYLFPATGDAVRTPGAIVRYGLVPLIGFGLCIWLWTSLEPFTWVIGIAWALIGLGILLVKTRFFRRPVPTLRFDEVVVDEPADESPTSGAQSAPTPGS
ncbi:amino acid transporter [Brevibacterium sanguinis]|uniref:Amino acid transporter n=2 Tax=Brevibacterium TaxID=1696 RepID=A0A366IHE3_9MICO|nr:MULTISPECIES: APC family permease [Brevibacterium]RBP64973.1 amino acid transporter [Brevibacterium sanguinis]RBP71236.1 amino acid transporter [Brevibacterium celere]